MWNEIMCREEWEMRSYDRKGGIGNVTWDGTWWLDLGKERLDMLMWRMRWSIYIPTDEKNKDHTVVLYLVVTLAKKLTGASADIKLGAMIVTLTIISVEIG